MFTEKEIWKEYPLNLEFEGYYRVEVSNKGRVKTFSSMHPDGFLVKGSMQQGFLCLRANLKKARTPKDVEKLNEIQTKIDDLNEDIRQNKNAVELAEKVSEMRQNRDALVQKRKKLNHAINKKRNINYCLLFHKAVAELFLEPNERPEAKFVIHKDYDKLNNHFNNLQWATQEEVNERYKKHPKVILREFKKQFLDDYKPNVRATKLSEEDVLVIKTKLKKGYTLRKLAKQFGVSDMQIHRIKTEENWSHVKLLEEVIKSEKTKKIGN